MPTLDKKLDRYTKEVFTKVFTGMNGKFTRFKIIMAIKDEPLNTTQISKLLGYDYKSIQRNLKILEQNNLVERIGTGYGDMFFLTDFTSNNLPKLVWWINEKKKQLVKKKTYIE